MKAAYIGIDILYPALTSLYDTGCEIIKIFSCRTDNYTEFNTKTLSFASEHGIPVQLDRIRKEDLHELVKMGCDFALCAGYYHIIPVIDELRIVNIHPACLPIGRGAWPMPVTILKGLTESGVTMHHLEKELDTGSIILQEKCPVYPDTDDLVTLTARQWQLIPGMIKTLVSDFDNLWNSAVPQGDGEYWAMPSPSDYTVTSDFDFEQADIILRAFRGYECFYINKENNEKLELIDGYACRSEDAVPDPPSSLKIKNGYILCERVRRINDGTI